MILSFPYQKFFNSKNEESFLLKEAKLSIDLFFTDNTKLSLDAKKAKSFKGFSIDITPDLIENDPLKSVNNVVVKKTISKIQLTFVTGQTHDRIFFKILEIKQEFTCMPTPKNDAQLIDYTLSPLGWINSSGKTSNSNLATHPLLKLKDLTQNKITINALIVDLTELWMHLHKDNDNYAFRLKHLSRSDRVTFKVWGNLSGNAFIWYSVIPKHVEKSEKLSPHVFFSPADVAEQQTIHHDETYLLKRPDNFKTDGHILMGYLLAPVDDKSIKTLQPKMTGANEPIELTEARNVVNFGLANDKKTITPKFWHIGAGFEKAFYGLNTQPQQIFLMPQDRGNMIEGKAVKGLQTLGPDEVLKQITDTIIDVLVTNTSLLGKGKDPIVKKDKLIFSCYSESGFDIWYAVEKYPKNTKAIICIEPQNFNSLTNAYGKKERPLGKDKLPDLVKQNIPVFIIGRHHRSKYKPQNVDLKKINLFPADPAKIFQYPPVPSSHDFVRYRVERIMDLTKDPFTLIEETNIMDDLAKRKPPVTGQKAFDKIFGPIGDLDNSDNNEKGFESWYSHHFALTGGQVIKLPAKGGLYDQSITYSTYFQEAVEKIG